MEKVLSISVAAYNMENYIRDTLNSVVNSDVKDLVEVIVVDDESTDNTVKIVEEYISEYPNVIKLIKQKNQGPGSTFNAALKVATGKYIKMVDADDFVNEESLNYVVNQLKNIDCDMVLTKMDYFDDAEKKVYFTAELGYEEDTVMDTINYDYIPEMNAISYRTKILQDNNIKLSNGFYTDMEYVIFPLLFVNSFNILYLCVESIKSFLLYLFPVGTYIILSIYLLFIKPNEIDLCIVCGGLKLPPNIPMFIISHVLVCKLEC